MKVRIKSEVKRLATYSLKPEDTIMNQIQTTIHNHINNRVYLKSLIVKPSIVEQTLIRIIPIQLKIG